MLETVANIVCDVCDCVYILVKCRQMMCMYECVMHCHCLPALCLVFPKYTLPSASVITSSILASSVPLVAAAVVQQSVFVQFVQTKSYTHISSVAQPPSP